MSRSIFWLGIAPLVACGSSSESSSTTATNDLQQALQFQQQQATACRAEVPSNVKEIKEAQFIYEAMEDVFLQAERHPATVSGKNPVAWDFESSTFNQLSWAPDGTIRGAYSVTTTSPSAATPGGDFKVVGVIDCDGDGVLATYTATKSISTTMKTANTIY